MPATPDDLFAYFRTLGIETRTAEHAPVFTVEEAKRFRGTLSGEHCKSLLLKDKKGALFLVVASEDRQVDLKRLRQTLGVANLSFARPEAVRETLGIEPGSVTPFALLNASARAVRPVLDRAMMAAERLNYHPLVNTHTTTIRGADLLRFLETLGYTPLIVDL